MIMSDNEFIEFLAVGRLRTELGDTVELPESMYKKGSRELNAEKTMMMVLKARSERKNRRMFIPDEKEEKV